MTSTRKEVERQPDKRSGIYISRKNLAIVISILAAVILCAALWFILRDSDAESSTKSLIKAYSKRRLIEPRLSGGFQAGEYNPAPDTHDIDTVQLDRAWKSILAAISRPDDQEARAAHGRYLLATGKSEQAIKLLRPLAAGQKAGPKEHNDFGACLFQQGMFEDAIDQFNIALEKNPGMEEALFNRALCYQKLQLIDAARDGLESLLPVEGDRGWKAEIAMRLIDFKRPLEPAKNSSLAIDEFKAAVAENRMDQARVVIDQSFVAVREYAIEYLIKEMAQAVKAGDVEKSSKALAMLELIGRLAIETKGDKEIATLARFIRELPDQERAANLVMMEDCIKQIDAIYAREYVRSLANMERLEKEFARRGNTVYQVVSAWMIASRVHYIFNRFNETIKALEPTVPIVRKGEWLYQQSRIIGQLSATYSRLGNDSLAIDYCRQSLDGFRKVGTFVPKALQLLSLPYWHLGDYDTSLKYLRESTALYLEKEPEPAELALNCLQAADIYRLRNRHDLSLLFAKQALAFTEKSKEEPFSSQYATVLSSKKYAAQASSLMAIEQARLNQFQQAAENIDNAFAYLEEVDKARARDYNKPLVLTRAGEVAACQGDFEKALDYYAQAEVFAANAQENIIPMIRVLRGRTDALVAAGRNDEARSNLDRALGLIETYRSKMALSDQRSFFLDASQAVFDQAIFLSMKEEGGYVGAFNLSERSRARALLEELSGNLQNVDANKPTPAVASQGSTDKSGKPLELDQICAALPDNLLLVEFSVTSQGTYIFLVTRSGFEVRRSEATTEMLDSLVSSYLSELRTTANSNDPAATEYLSRTSHALYDELLKPVEGMLKRYDYLCIVPDKSLHFLPFAALLDQDNQYLVASYKLSYAPSASVLVRCIKERDGQPAATAEKIFAVGNPSFSTSEFPGLKDLPDSTREATDVAEFYGKTNSLVLTGAAATKPRVLAELKDCDVAHLALHCLVKDDSLWRAALVLAPTTRVTNPSSQAYQTDSLLSLEEIYRVKFPRIKLTVLSACETGLGQYYRGEGMVSLVRPFIASNVPTVVASLWPVDSSATRELMVEFHKERKNMKGGPGEALQTAQKKMVSSGHYQHPYYWASFIVIGSSN